MVIVLPGANENTVPVIVGGKVPVTAKVTSDVTVIWLGLVAVFPEVVSVAVIGTGPPAATP